MGKTLILAIVSLFLLSAFVIMVEAAAEGYETGAFPSRTFYVTRSPPKGPRNDTYIASMTPSESGYWSARLDYLAGAAIIVELYHFNGGVFTLESSSKLRSVDQTSTPVALLAENSYQAWFTPYGKPGQSILSEQWKANAPPVACFTYTPTEPAVNQPVAFDASCSTDSDGTIVLYQWDFENDGIIDATGSSATHAYSKEGVYDATLRVTDNLKAWNTKKQSITVVLLENLPPVAQFSWSPLKPKAIYDTVQFDARASYDPEGSALTYDWTFGDLGTATGAMPTHVYAAAGLYDVTLTVTDDLGLHGSLMKQIEVVENQVPVVSFTWSPLAPKEGQKVDFDASASKDVDGTIADYHWVWGDGNSESSGTSPLASHTYAAGTYLVTLHVTDNNGGVGTGEATIIVAPIIPPFACFTISPAELVAGALVTFNAGCSSDQDGTIVSYAWDFGDGTTGSGLEVTHAYAAGDYIVTLRVTDNDAAWSETSQPIHVAPNEPPVAVIRYDPSAPMSGDPVRFDGSGSYDTFPTGDYIASYVWSFADDGSTQSGAIVTHTFAKSGTWRVTLTVTDSYGAPGSAYVDVAVGNRPPVAVLVVDPLSAYTYDPIVADGRGSYDPDGTITAYKIDWGDLTIDMVSSGTHVYTKSGTYPITLTVTDNFGASATDMKTVTILNQAPKAALSVTPLSAFTYEPFNADGRASTDRDGTIISAVIDWGDLTTSLGLQATHEYKDNGAYRIILTLTDDEGATSSAYVDVTVLNRAPTAFFTYSRASESYKDPVLFDASGSSDRDGTIQSYAWDFGDQSTGSGTPVTHKYAAPGTYTVALTVTDDDSATGSQSQVIDVVNLPPKAVLSVSPLSAFTYEDILADGSASTDPEGALASYLIDWGDTTTSPGPTATHRYADGTRLYTITLTVTDAFGATDVATATVEIKNRPPTASLSVSPLSAFTGEPFAATGTASDTDGTIASAKIDWGDSTVTDGLSGSHVYADNRVYTVTLTVTDDDGASASAFFDVTVLNRDPAASFTWAVRTGTLTVDFDASASKDVDGTIADYHWVWGDGNSESSGTSPLASHTYGADGTYPVTLHVTDNDGGLGTFSADVVVPPVGPPPAGAAWRFFDFFAVPYGEWWDMRSFFTSDHPINADCFSADGITYGWCIPFDPTLPDTPSYPYTNWVPGSVDSADGSIFAPYRFAVDAKGLATYSIDKPVILPTCAELKTLLATIGKTYDCPTTLPSGGSVVISESIDYVTTPRAIALRDRDDGSTGALRGCPDVVLGNDGFLTEVRLTLTMNAAGVTKLFGVTDPAKWTPGLADTSLIATGCGPGGVVDPESGLLEKGLKLWLEKQGNGPYDVSNSLGVPYDVVFLEASGSYDSLTGLHTFTLDLVGHGNEVLTARWFYWGATSYADGVSAGAAPAGWWGMETPWFEAFRMSAKIGTDPSLGTGFDASVSGDMQNHFRHMAEAGPDGKFLTTDDVLKWVWMPVLADRFAKSLAHPTSELTAYAGYTYIHNTVGSVRYGVAKDYDYVPALWPLKTGDSQRFEFPTLTVVLYDPLLSGPVINDPFGVVVLAAISTPIAFAYSVPATGVGTYDAVTRVLTVTGPTSVGTPPTTAGGKPLESRPMYNLLK